MAISAFTPFQIKLLRHLEEQMEAASKGIFIAGQLISDSEKRNYLARVQTAIEALATQREPTRPEEREAYELLGMRKDLELFCLSTDNGGPLPNTVAGIVLECIGPSTEKERIDKLAERVHRKSNSDLTKSDMKILEEQDRADSIAYPLLTGNWVDERMRDVKLRVLAANMSRPPREGAAR